MDAGIVGPPQHASALGGETANSSIKQSFPFSLQLSNRGPATIGVLSKNAGKVTELTGHFGADSLELIFGILQAADKSIDKRPMRDRAAAGAVQPRLILEEISAQRFKVADDSITTMYITCLLLESCDVPACCIALPVRGNEERYEEDRCC